MAPGLVLSGGASDHSAHGAHSAHSAHGAHSVHSAHSAHSAHYYHHHHPPAFVILRYILFIVECEIDPDCRTDQICHNNKCIDPCLVENPCAINAICQGQNHASRCTCPAGLVGNPYVNCETVECYINSDCDSSKACIQNECFDPCLLDNVCAPTAICRYVLVLQYTES